MRHRLIPIVISAALIFTAYAVFVQFAPFRISSGQNQSDTNFLRIENYLADSNAGTVMVGSSLTFRLPPALLGPSIANLAIAGGAPATGLALIRDADSRPGLVLVETNLLLRGVDEEMVRAALRLPERALRAHLRVWRAGYDPANVARQGLAAAMHKADFEPVPPPEVVRQLTQSQHLEKSHPPDLDQLRRNVAQVSSLVSALRAKGIRVGFFEMPVDSSLSNLPTDAMVRREALRAFPRDQFCWLALAVPGGAHTLDGIHLTPDDAALVARQVVDQRVACLRP